VEPSRLNLTDLYLYCRGWSQPRQRSFSRWELDDITHEAFLCAILLLEHHDPERGKVNTYLENFLYDRVRTTYQRLHDVKATREYLPSGKRGTREYQKWTVRLGPQHEKIAKPDKPRGIEVEELPEEFRELAYLLARGMRKQAIAYERGVTASAISHQLTRLRDWIRENRADA
jgi:DNA-binding NarL/FixJ family response regulator